MLDLRNDLARAPETLNDGEEPTHKKSHPEILLSIPLAEPDSLVLRGRRSPAEPVYFRARAMTNLGISLLVCLLVLLFGKPGAIAEESLIPGKVVALTFPNLPPML